MEGFLIVLSNRGVKYTYKRYNLITIIYTINYNIKNNYNSCNIIFVKLLRKKSLIDRTNLYFYKILSFLRRLVINYDTAMISTKFLRNWKFFRHPNVFSSKIGFAR